MSKEERDYTSLTLENEDGIYTVKVQRTELSVGSVIDDLVMSVLLAAGYSENSIKKYLDVE